MWLKLHDLCQDEAGATAIEYSLIASLIAVVIIASLVYVGDSMNTMYEFLRTTIDDAT